MNTEIKKSKQGLILDIKGKFTIDFVDQLKREVVALLNEKTKSVTVTFGSISSIDVAGIQLLQSIKKTCTSKKIPFKIEGTVSNELMPLLSNAGFDNTLNSNI